MGEECWNSVTVIGPSTEVRRFRDTCIAPKLDMKPRHIGGGWNGCYVEIGYRGILPDGLGCQNDTGRIEWAWNYRDDASESCEWSFGFDTGHDFPEQLFEQLASLFPALAFNCDCIDSADDQMGCGWYNTPPGGEPFRQGMRVPRNFWKGGGGAKRSPAAQARQDACIKALLQTVRQAEQDPRLPGGARMAKRPVAS